MPHYYWTGSPLALDMTANNTQKNLLVFGLAAGPLGALPVTGNAAAGRFDWSVVLDRKSTRLNSSHLVISYAVFCLKKKKQTKLQEEVVYHEKVVDSHEHI